MLVVSITAGGMSLVVILVLHPVAGRALDGPDLSSFLDK